MVQFDDFPAGLVARLWNYHQSPVGAADVASTIWPSSEQVLRDLLGISFYASLGREEGRITRATIAFTGSRFPGAHVEPYGASIPFARPLPLSAENLVKIAPAADPLRTRIGVFEHDQALYIWGLLHDGGLLEQFQIGEARVGVSALCLLVRLISPGHLAVDVSFQRLAEFAAGSVLVDALHVFDEPGPVLGALGNLARQLPSQGQESLPSPAGQAQRFLYHNCIRRLLVRMQAHGHGGILAVLPDAKGDGIKGGKSLRPESAILREAHLNALREEVTALRAATKGLSLNFTLFQETSSPAWSKFDVVLDTVSKLSEVDGALILGPELTITAFGATIEKTADDEGVRCFDVEGSKRGVAGLGELGHRHRAGAWLAKHRPGAVVFVVSQDGFVACFYAPSGEILMWRPLELYSALSLPLS